MRPEAFEPGLELLGKAIQLPGPIGHADFAAARQTQILLDRYLKKTGRGWKSVVYLYPPDNRWRREAPPDALRLARDLGPQAALAGTNVVNQRVREDVVHDAWIAGILGFVLVAILLRIDFGNIRHTFMALAPLCVGLLWMVGGMVATQTPMNFINIFVTTMIIGIGVDYGVHVLHRYLEVRNLPREQFESGIVETGKAVVAAALSTIVGFGSIIFSHYPGLQTTGKVAILGTMSTALIAITLVPAMLSWRYDRRATSSTAAERASGTSS
jgi:predicted RND superfamily exporter protein